MQLPFHQPSTSSSISDALRHATRSKQVNNPPLYAVYAGVSSQLDQEAMYDCSW